MGNQLVSKQTTTWPRWWSYAALVCAIVAALLRGQVPWSMAAVGTGIFLAVRSGPMKYVWPAATALGLALGVLAYLGAIYSEGTDLFTAAITAIAMIVALAAVFDPNPQQPPRSRYFMIGLGSATLLASAILLTLSLIQNEEHLHTIRVIVPSLAILVSGSKLLTFIRRRSRTT